jgi:hypothetical protein
MALRDAIEAGVQAAFTVVSDGLVEATVTHFTTDAPTKYDPKTGLVTHASTNYTKSFLRSQWTQREIYEKDVQAGEMKLMIPASMLGFEPREQKDYITINSEKWIIGKFWSDPYDTVYFLKMKRL